MRQLRPMRREMMRMRRDQEGSGRPAVVRPGSATGCPTWTPCRSGSDFLQFNSHRTLSRSTDLVSAFRGTHCLLHGLKSHVGSGERGWGWSAQASIVRGLWPARGGRPQCATFQPRNLPRGLLAEMNDSVHAACRQAVHRAAEAGARLAADQSAARAAAAPYPLRRLLQEVQRTHEALPAHQQLRQREAAQLGPVLPLPRSPQAALRPAPAPLPAATPCDEGMGVEEEAVQQEESDGDLKNQVPTPPEVGAGKPPTNPTTLSAGWGGQTWSSATERWQHSMTASSRSCSGQRHGWRRHRHG